MKHRAWEKDRKAMMITVPISTLWRFFQRRRDERRRKKFRASLAKLHRAAPWSPCPHCENYWCEIHQMHVHDCPCPPVEEWETSPYNKTGSSD